MGERDTVTTQTVTWNVDATYGISQRGISQAIRDAKARFATHPDDTVVLEFSPGTHRLKETGDGTGTFDLTGVEPGRNGRLVFSGAGQDRTTLIFNDAKHAIYGREVYRVSFIGMHMTREDYSVSQGYVAEIAEGQVVLDIQDGFPSPRDIYNPESDQGRFLRRYTDSRTDPRLIKLDNEQIPWTSATHLGAQRWQFNLKNTRLAANYSKGDLIGVKSKHGGQTYWFWGGSDILFKDVKWTHKTRGVFRGGFNKIQFVDCVTDRAAPINGQTLCLASPAGGPQIGQPYDPPTDGNLVEGCRFIASGDDAVAFFNAGGAIRNCTI